MENFVYLKLFWYLKGTADEQINKWGACSFDHFKELYHGSDAVKAGVQLLNTYQVYEESEATTEPAWKDIVFNFTHLSAEDIEKMGLAPKYVKGYKFGTFVVDQKYYMQYLTRILTAQGVKFEQRRLSSLDEVTNGGYDCVVNCTGLGAFAVAGDESMYPIRGQVLRVR